MVDYALSRMLGLYVVARLAQRYNIKVQLRHSWYGGITALVLLPPTVAVRAPMPEALEAPRRGPAELVASTKPAEPAAEETGEHLPIFEAARSDWFEDSVRGDHLPLRRHAAQQPAGRAAEPTGNGAGTLTGAGAARPPGAGPGDFGFGASRPEGPPDRTPSDADAARAEALRAEAMRVETARMEAARAETERVEAARAGDGDGAPTARSEGAETGPAPAGAGAGGGAPRPHAPPPTPPPPQPHAGGAPGSTAGAAHAEAPPGPTARAGRQRGEGARARAGPLPTRIPGASGPPPGGAKPFAPAATPGAGQPVGPTAPPPTGRSNRRADRVGADRLGADRGAVGQAPGSDPAPAEAPAPASSTLQAASVQTTKAGLPRRVPRANLAPGMVAAQAAAPAARPATAGGSQPSPSAGRSPEEVRSMLSSYRSGLERGRMMAAGEDADRGGDAHSSSRSDDDATQ
jgi:hypothetical protein